MTQHRKTEVRDAAYVVCAKAMLGEEMPADPSTVTNAMLMVMADDRMSKTTAQESVRSWVAMVLFFHELDRLVPV